MRSITIISSVLVSLFLAAGVADKVVHWYMFVLALARNPLVPTMMSGAVAGGVLTVESAVALLLLAGPTRRSGLVLASLLFCSFTCVVALLLWLAPAAQCGCSFMSGFDTPTPHHLLLNVLIALLCGYLCTIGHRVSPTINGVRPPGVTAATISSTSDQRSAP
jgi:hypothetical protein